MVCGPAAGEPGIPGVTVVLTGTNDQGTITPETTTTAANGSYSFGNLRPGTYTVTDTPPSGFLDGLLTRGNVTPIAGSVGTHDIGSITVAVGGTAAENDFAELPPATVSGFVYQDLNDNGLRASSGEPGIPGVTVVLTGTNDQGTITPETTTTAANGSYSFGNLRPGTYTVTDTPPSGFLDGLLTRGNVTPIAGSVGTHDIGSITVAVGGTAAENDFAELPPATVSGFVYQDLNDNGLRASTGEPGIPGVTVVLTGTNDQGTITPETTTTAANGSYSFGNLRPGTYTVTDTPPSGFLDGLLTRGNVTPIAGSVGTHDIGSITVAAGGTAAENDFAELPPAIVSGFVYQDLNDNGLRASTGEPGISWRDRRPHRNQRPRHNHTGNHDDGGERFVLLRQSPARDLHRHGHAAIRFPRRSADARQRDADRRQRRHPRHRQHYGGRRRHGGRERLRRAAARNRLRLRLPGPQRQRSARQHRRARHSAA